MRIYEDHHNLKYAALGRVLRKQPVDGRLWITSLKTDVDVSDEINILHGCYTSKSVNTAREISLLALSASALGLIPRGFQERQLWLIAVTSDQDFK